MRREARWRREKERKTETKEREKRAAGGRRPNLRQTERKRAIGERRREERESARENRMHAERESERAKESAVGSRESAAALSVMNPRGRCETTRTVRILSSPVPARCMQKWLKAVEREVERSRQ